MSLCKQCVLDERFPGVSFDDHGVCNYCRAQKDRKDRQAQKDRCERRFRDLLREYKGKSEYDCLVAYSGGKDSTYTLHLLKEHYELKILAFSFDNWYQSETATRNIKAVLRNMNVDHLTIMPSYEVMKAIIRASVSKDLHSAKALMRASSICTSCISLIRFGAFKMAIEKKIPVVAFGLSPGQAPLATSVVKTQPGMIRMMQRVLLRRLVERVGDQATSFFLQERHFHQDQDFPYSINPLAFVDYDEAQVYRVAQQYGWRKPGDTDANSTNCLLNALANQVHIEHFGFNPYAYEVAELVRSGGMTRTEGLSRLSQPQSEAQVLAMKEELEMV